MQSGDVDQDSRQTPSERGRAWRFVVTAGGFAWFWLYALYLGTVAARIVRRDTESADASERAMRARIQHTFGRFLGVLERGGAMRVELDADDAAVLHRPNQLIVANHPTMIDAAAILAQCADAVCVAKREDWTHPFLRSAVRAAGMIPNMGGRDVIAASVAALEAGASLVFFPEGTRSPRGTARGTGPFQRGAAHVALESGFDLLPVRIVCDPSTLGKSDAWYSVPARPFVLRLEVGESIRVTDYLRPDLPGPLAARMLTAALEESFAKGLYEMSEQKGAS
jgi:1-acyl-sn-glycerol-3-phosphate acyltransferase